MTPTSANTGALSANMRGAALMSAGMAAFVFNDVAIKYFGADIPLFLTIFVRGLLACAFIGGLALYQGIFRQMPKRRDIGFTVLRAFAELGATICFLTALFHMPLANLTAILQSASLVITLAAVVFLGERVGRQRALAIVLGFVGVICIIRPSGDGFNGYSLLGVAAVFWVAFRDLMVRKLSSDISSLFVTFVTAALITVVAGILVQLQGQWVALTVTQVAGLAFAAVLLFGGYFCAVAAMRFGEMSFVTPFRYTSMIWAIALGWVVFGELPDNWTAFGIFVIIGAGLYSWSRERNQGV